MQIEILINKNSYQTWSLFFGRYLGSSRKVVKLKNGLEEDHTQVLEHSKVLSVRVFFYVHVFCGMPFNEKQTAYWKSLKFISLCFSNFWSSSNHKWRRQLQWHLTKGFKLHARFHFFAHLFAFVCKKKNLIIRSSKFWEHKHLAEWYQIQNARVQSSK